LVTNSERAENEFSKNGEIFTEELPKVVLSSKDVEKYKNYYIPDFIEDYIINVKNGILKEFPDQNWEIIGTNWNKIHRIKAEKIFNDGSLTIDNTVPLTYNDIKDMAEQITLKYSVESGDWLLKISRIYGVDYKSIAEKNNIENPDLIFPNQVFVIPEN
jgi:nucleoid-associated protein YgaU